jgi:FAD synthetase
MMLERLVTKYIKNAENVFMGMVVSKVTPNVDKEKVEEVIEHAKRYLEDAKYYQRENKLETGLASISYCEGLLDALRLLGMVEFSWPTGK